MAALQLRTPQPREDHVENWDDDDFMIEEDDLNLRTSAASSVAGLPRRDSISSHMSMRSERRGDEEQQVLLPGDDEKSTTDAIATAKRAGIPIPANVPASALMGGTIKRLGGRKVQKMVQDDWDEDMAFPDNTAALKLKTQPITAFPDDLQEVSLPMLADKDRNLSIRPLSEFKAAIKPLKEAIDLGKYKDTEDDEFDFLGDGYDTIKPSGTQRARPISVITPPTPSRKEQKQQEDIYDDELELPKDGHIRLSHRLDAPRTPTSTVTDDFEWGEGSLGTRFAGTRRGPSGRSSTASAMSPSVSSTFTGESEDESVWDGIVLPSGPLNFKEKLARGRRSQEPIIEEEQSTTPSAPIPAPAPLPTTHEGDDMFDGLDIGEDNIFDSGKRALHRNVKVQKTATVSPTRPKTTVSLTFTDRPGKTTSRLPRPSSNHQDRPHPSTSLEPVSETGGPIPARPLRRTQSRVGHSAQSSISSLATPTSSTFSATSYQPPTPRRREVAQKTSAVSLRGSESTSALASSLRMKRSMPAIKPVATTAPRPPTFTRTYDRPPSRSDLPRPQSALRPKTPVDRPNTNRHSMDSLVSQARNRGPTHLPPQQPLSSRGSRQFRRHDSDYSQGSRSDSRAMSRSTMRSPSPAKSQRGVDHLVRQGAMKSMTRPKKAQNFGSGFELDGFDDLPTSATAEAIFVKQPVAAGNPKSQLRNKVLQNFYPARTASPAPPSNPRQDQLPHFARETVASRLARESAIARRGSVQGPLAPMTAQRVAQLPGQSNLSPHYAQDSIRSKKSSSKTPQRPTLIRGLTNVAKREGNMSYNPETCRWEGNENDLSSLFDAPVSSPSAASLAKLDAQTREKENTPRMALIANVGSSNNRVVDGMVFDSAEFKWLKIPKQHDAAMSESVGFEDDDEDPFADIPDLEDRRVSAEQGSRTGDAFDEFPVGEEFDVGPRYIADHRKEEKEWRSKCEKWAGTGFTNRPDWGWNIRDIAASMAI